MMVIMSIIGVMFSSRMVSGSASLRANERMAFFPCSREICWADPELMIAPSQNPGREHHVREQHLAGGVLSHGVQGLDHDLVGDLRVGVEGGLGFIGVLRQP